MNEFDKRYDIRLAKDTDIDIVMAFICENWNQQHILGNKKDFFMYEHMTEHNQVNFVLAIDKETLVLEGISGFLKASEDCSHLDVWSVMWMIREKVGNMAFLGVELIKRTQELLACRSVLGIGDNPKTAVPVLQLILNYHVGKMKQFYRLNSKIEHFNIANIQSRPAQNRGELFKTDLIKLETPNDVEQFFNFESYKESIPYKDLWYMNHRYFQHPLYQYTIYACTSSQIKEKALLVTRKVSVGEREIVRIVDYLGSEKLIGGLYDDLGLLMSDKCEYIDFYCYGFEESYLIDAGFTERKDDTNIIPNYFEPFVQENVDIYVDSPYENVKFCKADGDQDRPNRI